MQKARIAVVGLGTVGQTVHLPILSKIQEVEIVAVCDLEADPARDLAGKLHRMSLLEFSASSPLPSGEGVGVRANPQAQRFQIKNTSSVARKNSKPSRPPSLMNPARGAH